MKFAEITEGAQIANRWRAVAALESGSAKTWRVIGPGGKEGELLPLPDSAALRERMAAVADLRHENILAPLELVDADGEVFLIRELAAGMTVAEWIVRDGPLDYDQALGIACQLCLAAEEAEKRDVPFIGFTAERVLVTPDGFAKVDPLGGLFVAADDPFRSPEERRGEKADGRSDNFRIALLTYFMLSGKPVKMNKIGAPDLLSLHKKDEKIPVELDRLIDRAVAVEANERPQTATHLLDGLHPLLMEKPVPAADGPSKWYEDKRFWLYTAGALFVLLFLMSLFSGLLPFFAPK